MTFIEKFNELKAKYGTVDESKLTDSFAVQIEMTDEDCGGIFYVAYMNSVFSVEPYDYHDNTAAVRVSSSVLEGVLSCKADPVAEFLAGNISVDGDAGHVLMLVELMKKEEKKPAKKPAKKTAEKKAAEKKPAEKKTAEKKPAEKKTAEKKTATKKSSGKKAE